MIPRYSRPAMAALWSPEERYRIWFEIEAAAAEAMAELGTVPRAAAAAIRERGTPRAAAIGPAELAEIDAIEATTKHDVIAFLTWMGQGIGEDARWMHLGMTSSDVLDTAFAVQLTRAADLLIEGTDRVLAALRARAEEHRHTPTIGRSHGIHAEPTTFGLKLLGHWAEFRRNRDRLIAARAEVATCAISGPVGTFAAIDPTVEAAVAARLGLRPEPVSTQVIPRDRHAAFFATLAVVAGGVERLATEIRHLQRTEVREAEEFFSPGQKGSSAMPHKRNPVLSENLTGLARLVRGYSLPALEDVALWHERDISHSAVERVIAPDATVTLDFALHRLAGLIERLVVHPARMAANLEALRGVVHSGAVLLALAAAGLSREGAYAAVQEAAMAVWDRIDDPHGPRFRDVLLADPAVAGVLSPAALEAVFARAAVPPHVDAIFARVLTGR